MGGCGLLCLALVALTGGDLRRLAELRLRSTPLLFLALAVQVLITDVVEGDAPRPLLISAHLATYGLAGVFVWHNRHVPGLALLSVGAACNAVTIALNGGRCPPRPKPCAGPGSTSHRQTSPTPASCHTHGSDSSATCSPFRLAGRWPTCSASATSSSCWGLRGASTGPAGARLKASVVPPSS